MKKLRKIFKLSKKDMDEGGVKIVKHSKDEKGSSKEGQSERTTFDDRERKMETAAEDNKESSGDDQIARKDVANRESKMQLVDKDNKVGAAGREDGEREIEALHKNDKSRDECKDDTLQPTTSRGNDFRDGTLASHQNREILRGTERGKISTPNSYQGQNEHKADPENTEYPIPDGTFAGPQNRENRRGTGRGKYSTPNSYGDHNEYDADPEKTEYSDGTFAGPQNRENLRGTGRGKNSTPNRYQGHNEYDADPEKTEDSGGAAGSKVGEIEEEALHENEKMRQKCEDDIPQTTTSGGVESWFANLWYGEKRQNTEDTSERIFGIPRRHASKGSQFATSSKAAPQYKRRQRPISLQNLCYMESAIEILKGSDVLTTTFAEKSDLLSSLKLLSNSTLSWDAFVGIVKDIAIQYNTTEQGDVWDFLQTVYKSEPTKDLERYFFLKTEATTEVKCCKETQVSHNSYPLITVYPDNKLEKYRMTTLFNSFLTSKVVSGAVCQYCEKKTEMWSAERIVAYPEVISIQISRWKGPHSFKNKNRVLLEEELKAGNELYRLFGLIVHYGASTLGGHYICVRKRENKWYCIDGRRESLLNCSLDEFSSIACGAFYRRTNLSTNDENLTEHSVGDHFQGVYWILKLCGIFEDKDAIYCPILKLFKYLFNTKEFIPWEHSCLLLENFIQEGEQGGKIKSLWDFFEKIVSLKMENMLAR